MQGDRNYAKQELIYDLLFGNGHSKNKGSKITKESNLCLICNKYKDSYENNDGNLYNNNELICIKCKRILFSLEGFKYQCKEVKNKISNLENISILLSEQMRRLNNVICREKNKNYVDERIPDWCNRDIPSKYGKGGFDVRSGIKEIKNKLISNEENKLSNQLILFHDDLLNLQETIITFINVLDTYIETPWISLIRKNDYKSNNDNISEINIQPCLSSLSNKMNENTSIDNSEYNKTNSTTAQRIERIRKQQEKVRQQIKSLYDNTINKSPKNFANINNIDDYFSLNEDTRLEIKDNVIGFNNYDILWSPSSSSSLSSSSPPSATEVKSQISGSSFYPKNIEKMNSNLSD